MTSVAALLFAYVSIGHVMEDLVRRGVEEKLDTQMEALAKAVTPSGELMPSKVPVLPEFGEQDGWGWIVRTPAGSWAGGTSIDLGSLYFRDRHHHGQDQMVRGRGRSTAGMPLYLRERTWSGPVGITEVIAASPAHTVDEPISEALGSIMISLALLGGGLATATFIQLRFGLRPLRDLSVGIGKIRRGESESLSLEQPQEIRPLAEEINALIVQNAAGLGHARRHVSNLAHGLKTPLATLSLRLANENVSEETRALVDQLDSRIAHHLTRARSAALREGGRSRTQVAGVITDLIATLQKMHADRALEFTSQIDPGLIVAVEHQDLEEILGNLTDNAAKFARSAVTISALTDARSVQICIEDDGPGMPAEGATEALQRGRRLDESGVGYGFGLSIAQELIELYGGGLDLSLSKTAGGLRVLISLPRAGEGGGDG